MTFRDPDAALVARELATGEEGDPRVVISNDPGRRIRFESDHPAEIEPGTIDSDYDPVDQSGSLVLTGPRVGPDGFLQAAIYLSSRGDAGADNPGESYCFIDASQIGWSGQAIVPVPILNDVVWNPVTFAGTWTDVAGSRVGVRVDAAGNTHIRGQVQGGGAGSLIFTLDRADMCPTQTIFLLCHAGAGTGVECCVRITAAGEVSVFTQLASAVVALRLNLSFCAL